MRLEYRILEITQGDEQECNFCLLDFDDPTLLNFDTATATHQMVALTLSLSVVNVKKIMIIILFHDVRNVVG